MKKSKLLILVLTIAIALTAILPLSVFAAGGKIQITPPPEAGVDGNTFKAFQIFTVEANADETSFVYELNPVYAEFEVYYSQVLNGDGLKEYILGLIDSSGELIPSKRGELESLARALWNWSNNNNGANAVVSIGTGAGVSFDSLDAGYYIVAGESIFNESAAISFAALCTVLDNGETTQVAFKADAPAISKEVMNHHGNDWEKWTDVSVGDRLSFKLSSTVPNTSYYEQYTYKVIDRISNGITFDAIESVIAYKNTTPKELSLVSDEAADGYRFSGITPLGQDTVFTVTVNSETIKSLFEEGYDRIEIIYNAALNENAVVELNGNPNYVYLEYSNDPNWVWDGITGSAESESPTGETPEDAAWVYTYKINIYKYSSNDTALEGVQFCLLLGNSIAEFEEVDGKYVFQGFIERINAPDDSAEQTEKEAYEAYLAKTVLVTDELGMIYITGIDEGQYTLNEFKALPGYNLADNITLTVYNHFLDSMNMEELIAYLNEHCGEDYTGTSLLSYAEITQAEQISVYNGKGSIFPVTGGAGVYIFYSVGACLTAALIAFFVIRKKRSLFAVEK